MTEVKNEIEIVEDGMIGDPDNGVPRIEVDPATGQPVNSDTPKYDALTTVQQALEAKPVDFENSINRMLADRLQDAVEKRREEIARSIFNGQDEEPISGDEDSIEGSEEEAGEFESVDDEVEETTSED